MGSGAPGFRGFTHTRRHEGPLCHLIVGRPTGHRRVQEEGWRRKTKKGSQCSGRREVLAYCWRRRRGKLWQLDRDFHHRDAEQPLYRGWEQLLHLCNQGRFGKGGGRGHMEVYMRQLRPEVEATEPLWPRRLKSSFCPVLFMTQE